MKSKNKIDIDRTREWQQEHKNCAEDAEETANLEEKEQPYAERVEPNSFNVGETVEKDIYKVKPVENYKPDDEVLPPNVEVIPSRKGVKILITLAVGLAVSFGVMLFSGIFVANGAKSVLRILTDAFFVCGVLFGGIGLLRLISNQGTFDGIAYAGRSALGFLIPPAALDKGMTYSKYVEKRREKVKTFLHFIIAGVIFIVVSIIFLIVYYAVE